MERIEFGPLTPDGAIREGSRDFGIGRLIIVVSVNPGGGGFNERMC